MSEPYYADATVTVHAGDCLAVLRELDDCSVDSVVTDPPYSLSFLSKAWDTHATPAAFQAWCELWATECLRVLRPGGHLLAFGGTRTSHRLACAIEDAGFEIRDSIAWLYGSGFPKSLDVGKAIDKAAGAEREIFPDPRWIGKYPRGPGGNNNPSSIGSDGRGGSTLKTDGPLMASAPATPDAERWQGWGTALKPAWENVVCAVKPELNQITVARKPLAGTVAANVLAHGTGALNVDGCRVATSADDAKAMERANSPGSGRFKATRAEAGAMGRSKPGEPMDTAAGRWPPNVVLDESQAEVLDAQSGESASKRSKRSKRSAGRNGADGAVATFGLNRTDDDERGHNDTGGASRFMYVAKAGAGERIRLPKVGGDDNATSYGRMGLRVCNVCENRSCPGNWIPGDSRPWPACGHGDWEWQKQKTVSEHISHPTVKPLSLMRWLVRLVTPPGGTVLEPFAGSGTTVEACILEGFRCVAIEREADYLPLIMQRIHRRRDPVAYSKGAGDDGGLFSLLDEETT